MTYIKITTADGCDNLGLFVSLYDKWDPESGEHRYLLVCGDQTYDCKNIESIATPMYQTDFVIDGTASKDATGCARFTRMLSMLIPV